MIERRGFQPGDVINVGDDFYRVSGVYLGALNCVDLIGLEPMTERPGNAGGPNVTEMLVPEKILAAAVRQAGAYYRNAI